jgi:hypothetical protein
MSKKVTFIHFGDDIASSRLRAIIPQKELKKLGVSKGNDVVVYGKHFLSFDQIRGYGEYVYDICDNHFDTPELSHYYHSHAEKADFLTCNSEVMQKIIKEKTGRDSVIIPEPYESDERRPSIGNLLYWYGHKSNLCDLERLKPSLKGELIALSNPKWTRELHNKIMKNPLIVVIPTGKSMAKSENRMVEAIRQGKYVCAEHLPAYDKFSKFYPLGDIPKNIERALSDPEKSLQKIRDAQVYVKNNYSPAIIGTKWMEVIYGNYQSQRASYSGR